jgi:amino acid adenylation domain-containing protein
MNSSSFDILPQHSEQQAGGESSDLLFWLSKVDADLPRAMIVPDRKRSTATPRAYDSVGFELGADDVHRLRSTRPSRGISDLELCAGLLAVLLAKYQREDRLVIGLMADDIGGRSQNLVPLSLNCTADASFEDVVDAVGRELVEMSSRSAAVVGELPQVLGVESGTHRYPLFDIAVAVVESGAAVDLSSYPVDLAFVFERSDGRIRGRVLYATDLYEQCTILRVAGHLEAAAAQLASAAARPKQTLRDLDIMSEAERHQVLRTFNSRESAYPLRETLHALFEAQVRRTPHATAVIHRRERLSYAALNERANRLARTLLSLGLTKGEFVGILLHRGCDFAVAMLAVFKAGGAYVPLDPTYPRDRIGYMLNDSGARYLVTDAAVAGGYASAIGECETLRAVMSLDGRIEGWEFSARPGFAIVQPEQIASAPLDNPMQGLTGADRAYMIYTSGSTGRPKGAICRHDGAINHLFGELEGIGVDSPFNFLQTAASSSDISVWQFMAPLLHGGATVIADYETVVDPALLVATMREHAVTIAEPVPVVLRALVDHLSGQSADERALPHLHCMMCTGEALPAELVDRWLTLFPAIPIANTYGPTETSDDVTLHVVREPIAHRCAVTPIGQPLPNVRVLLLDRDLRAVALGVPGEICIAGVAVGEGYWQQPERTEAAFVPCPYPEVDEGRMYRTGDLGRWLEDGSIEFLGRIDQQVKVRGFRIEPGEIEEVMNRHEGIQDAAVVAVEDSTGNRRLVGYFVPRPDALGATPVGLRQFLRGKLAEHMVPSALVPLGTLPLTPLGKIDRRLLARMQATTSVEAAGYVGPRNDVEGTLAQVWGEVVGLSRVGIHDNFFEIGGDSLSTISVVTALRQRGFALAPRHLFRYPTIAELGSHLASTVAAGPAERPAHPAGSLPQWDIERWREQLAPLFPDLEDVYPLSATQRGIYFQSLLMPRTSGAYVEQIAFDLIGELDESAFRGAWQQVTHTHGALRTAVIRRGAPHPLQVVVRHCSLVPSFLDLRELGAERQSLRLEALIADDRAKGFDLKRPPLCRVTLVRLSDQRWRVLWTYHHLILDGWSEPMVLGAVFKAYDAIHTGLGPAAPERFPYREFVNWSESQDLHANESYWRTQLAGFVSPTNIRDTSPAVTPPSTGEITHGWEHARLDPSALSSLEQTTRGKGLTLSTLLHGAWALLLHRRTGAADVAFGSIASGRQCAMTGIDSVCGLVAVTQLLRTRVPMDATVVSWLRVMQLQMAEMREHEHTPLALIQQWSEVPAERRPLFDSIVVVGNYAGSDLSVCSPATLRIDAVEYYTQPLFALTLFATVAPQLAVSLVYDKRHFAPATAQLLTAEYLQLLAGIAGNPEQRIASLLARPLTETAQDETDR